MKRIYCSALCLIASFTSFAAANYQIDLILFTQLQSGDKAHEHSLNSLLLPISDNVIHLKSSDSKSTKPYTLLRPAKSSLADEYYQLNHKRQYRVLGHYSWIQPAKNQSTIALPTLNHNGWKVQGTLRVRQSNYYLFDSDLQLSPPSNPDAFFTVSQKQRLKPQTVYFLDHPQLGMLVKIHQVS